MDIFEPQITFDTSKPFYPLVINYLAQVHGFVDMASRGLLLKLEEIGPEGVEMLIAFEGHKEKGFDEAVKSVHKGGKTGLIGDQEHQSKAMGKGVKVKADALAKEIFSNHAVPLSFFNRMSAGSLLILAHEITKAFHTHDPLWEFLRHCRNAAAHKGFFNFKHGEPKRPAQWRTLEIAGSLHGTPLFNDLQVSGFMGTGDALHLLSDVEQSFPEIQ